MGELLTFAQDGKPMWLSFLIGWGPLIIIAGLIYFVIIRPLYGGQAKAMEEAAAELQRQEEHRRAVESKLQRIIELLEQDVNRP